MNPLRALIACGFAFAPTVRRQGAILLLLFLPGLALAQDPRALHKVVLPGEARGLLQRIENIDRLIAPEFTAEVTVRFVATLATTRNPLCESTALALELGAKQKWEEAFTEFLQVIDESGDDLVPLVAGSEEVIVSTQVRRLCETRMVFAPLQMLQRHRERIDRSAKKWLDEGLQNRDPAPLRRLVVEFFLSSHTARALDILGDLAFEKGDFAEALQYWQTIEKLGPHSGADLPRVHAKQVLAHIFSGDAARARRELDLFEKQFASQIGQLGGQKGSYVNLLQSWLRKLEAGAMPLDEPDWPTFAGSAARNRVLHDPLNPRLWADGPAWMVNLQSGESHLFQGVPVANSHRAKRLAYHPIIVGQRAIVADHDSISAFNLTNGKREFRYEKKDARPASEPDVARYTLSAANDKVYARLGASVPEKKGAAKSYLVCLELGGAQATERWVAQARGPDGEPAVFQGAPLLFEGRAYIAMLRHAGGRYISSIACYEGGSGAVVWVNDVCDIPLGDDPQASASLLTLAGSTLVYCSDSGAIVSLDPWTGRRLWAVRYPPRPPAMEEQQAPLRDLSPPVFAGGKLFLAPTDTDRLLCLDAVTGKLLWQRERTEVVHLLGASNGLLFFTTRGTLQAIDADTGLHSRGWVRPMINEEPSFGRGLLMGGMVIWPTQRGLVYLLAQDDGRVMTDVTQQHRLWPGNMAYANGCLVVADTHILVGYLPSAGK